MVLSKALSKRWNKEKKKKKEKKREKKVKENSKKKKKGNCDAVPTGVLKSNSSWTENSVVLDGEFTVRKEDLPFKNR